MHRAPSSATRGLCGSQVNEWSGFERAVVPRILDGRKDPMRTFPLFACDDSLRDEGDRVAMRRTQAENVIVVQGNVSALWAGLLPRGRRAEERSTIASTVSDLDPVVGRGAAARGED